MTVTVTVSASKTKSLIYLFIFIAPCGKGKYLDRAYDICKYCSAGQYQPFVNGIDQASCRACQDGFTNNANHDGCVEKG